MVGEPPTNYVVSQWESLEKAQAWLASADWKALRPQREKSYRTVRQFIVRQRHEQGRPPAGASAWLASAQQTNSMKLSIQVENRILTANLIDSKTTRDFVSLLPLTLTRNDLFGREKWGQLPRPISEDGTRVRSYDVGDVIYWSPSAHVAIFCRHDGQSIPAPGIIVMGKMSPALKLSPTRLRQSDDRPCQMRKSAT